jgi:hypothetical protein
MLVVVFISGASGLSECSADTVDEAIAAIRSVGLKAEGHAEAIPAAKALQQLPAEEIPRVLDAARDVNPIAENWIRGIVFGIAESSGPPSIKSMQEYIQDTSRNDIGRGLAMELIRLQDPQLAVSMIDSFLNDSSLALREMAVEQAIASAAAMKEDDQDAAVAKYREALEAARHPKQLERIVDALDKLGQPVTTVDAFSLITQWNAVAPFDNVAGVGFDRVYPPEEAFAVNQKVDLGTQYEGKDGAIGWQTVEGSSDEGIVDLAAAYNKEKGAVAYLYTEFVSAEDQPAQVRLGCINANKVWVNGKEVTANEVYHSGSMIDQYVASCQLNEGINRILLKVCQNEQEQPWAQRWEFQFRITDPTGKGLVSGQ